MSRYTDIFIRAKNGRGLVKQAMAPVICIVGPDGSGKTRLAKRLIELLTEKGIQTRYVWFRLPYFFTFVLLGLSKILRLTKYVRYGKDQRVTIYDFGQAPLDRIYPIVVLYDALIYYALRVAIPSGIGFVVVCDRWMYDIIVDIAMNTHNARFPDTFVGRFLRILASRATLVVLVSASDSVLDTRRPEARLDPWASRRRSLYRYLAKECCLPVVSSEEPIEVCFGQLERAIDRHARLSPPEKVYANCRNVWLRRLLKRQFFAMAANWIFQETLIMSRDERVFRFGLELAMAFAIFVSLSWYVSGTAAAALLSLLIAHSLNWTLNGNFWVVHKFFGRKCSSMIKMQFLTGLGDKARLSEGIRAIAAFGSLSRGQLSDSSDLDVRILRRPDAACWFRANLFTFGLRLSAFVRMIPLDVLVRDEINHIRDHIAPGEPPVVVYDPENLLPSIGGEAVPLQELQKEKPVG